MLQGPVGGFAPAGALAFGGFPNQGSLPTLGEWNDALVTDSGGFYLDGLPTYGSKTIVSSGPSGAPPIGGSHFVNTFYAGGTEGGHDPQRHVFDTGLSSLDELFFGAVVQFKSDYPRSNNQGGGKEFILTFNGGVSARYFLNCDIGYGLGRWEVYEASTPLRDIPSVGSHPEFLTSVSWAPGSWQMVEWYLKRSTGAMKLWFDGTLALDRTGMTFPGDGTFASIYDDGENNGNRIPPSVSPDPRYINNTVANVDAYRWTSALLVAGA